MGFTVYYRSTEPVEPATKQALGNSLKQQIQERAWISCEPPGFFGNDGQTGPLIGGSKPNFMPQPTEYLNPENELPDGTIQDVVDILCKLSTEYSVALLATKDHVHPGIAPQFVASAKTIDDIVTVSAKDAIVIGSALKNVHSIVAKY